MATNWSPLAFARVASEARKIGPSEHPNLHHRARLEGCGEGKAEYLSRVRCSGNHLSIHALCRIDGLIFEDLQGRSFSDLGLLSEPIRVERGLLAPPARPGQGIVLDDAALRRHEVTGKATDVAPARR